MTSITKIALSAAIFAMGTAGSAFAQQRCTEGRTASGACVNPVVASMLRSASIHMNQTRINEYLFPGATTSDGVYPRGFEVGRFENGPNGTGRTPRLPLSP